MSKLVIVPLLFAACAKTGTMASDVPQAPHAKVDLVATGNAPKPLNAQLPSADRIVHRIRADVGDVASADINLCIAPDGHVLGVLLVRSSSSPALDGAILKDAPQWQFSELHGASSRTCETATLTYNIQP